MSKKFDLGRYEHYSYDRFHCVRPSLSLIAAMLFLCRGFVASVATAVSSFGDVHLNINNLLLVSNHWSSFATAMPAMLVLCALLGRVPTAPCIIRLIWKYGRPLLVISILAQSALIEGLTRNGTLAPLDNLSDASLAILGVNLIILGYISFSARVKDTFADFCARPTGDQQTRI